MRSDRFPAVRPVVFDAPGALLELVYARAALGLAVFPDMPQVWSPPEPQIAPQGATERWTALFDAAAGLSTSDTGRPPPSWLTTDDAEAVDVDDARAWLRQQRPILIESALMVNEGNVPRITKRAESLQQTTIDRVAVLPLDGHYGARPSNATLIVSLVTFLDDDAWNSTLARLT